MVWCLVYKADSDSYLISTPQDKKSQKKNQNVFSSVSYRSTTAPNHELEGSVCLFLDLKFFCDFLSAGVDQAMRHRIKRHLNERTTMLAGVSHDLRTPLTRMRLQLALVKKTPEIEELTKDISEMEAMIETYLAFSRGEVSDPPHQGDIRQLLKDITRQLQKSYPDRLTLIFNEDDIPEFPIRASSLRRALMNILENALRYAQNAEIRVRRREDTVLIQIDDDGPGIPLERRAEAILPFKRLEASRNQQTGGTGLGLSIASDIILSHGGQLDLLDSPMGGLRVYVILPI